MKKIICFLLLANSASVAFSLNPSREYKVRPDKYGMVYKEEKVPTKDGASLNAWFFELDKKTTNWIVISGSGDGNMADNIELAGQFMSIGWNVCMYDYRGYGASSDFNVDPDTYIYPQFINDFHGVLDYLRKTRAVTKFDLYGQNIGAGLSIGVGANRTETRKIIADGPWTGLEQMKKKFKERKSKDIIIPFGFDKTFEPFYAFDKARTHLRGILAIVTPQDEMIKPDDMKLIKGLTSTFLVPTSPSNSKNFETDKNAYFERVKKFLEN